jgi:formylglycine-generating enzyme required for sulfatase activity
VPLPSTANKALVRKIQQGKVKLADLAKGGATQLGAAGDDYAPCADSGQNCTNDVYAVSLPGVLPAASLTWFQAQAACKNARKRLPTSAEWQAAVIGTPDPGPDDGVSDCNSTWQHDGSDPAPTGSRSDCVSADGAFDMVGNVYEFAADWVPGSTGCGSWNESVSPTGDSQCFVGASTTGEPSTLLRGGSFMDNQHAGPLLIGGGNGPSWAAFMAGFRCAR